MPILQSAKKNIRKSNRKRVINDKRRRTMREQLKSLKTMSGKDLAGAKQSLPRAIQAIDKAAKAGVIKKNTASRKKARLSAMLKKLG